MENAIKCKLLKAIFTQEKPYFDGPRLSEFQINNPTDLHIKIEQQETRTITIASAVDTPAASLYSVFTRLERLLMMFDGRFFHLQELQFLDSDNSTSNQLTVLASHCCLNRLAYFNSIDFCKYKINKLLDYDLILTADLYRKWEVLLDELSVVHQMFLYSLCDGGPTKDIKCAFLIELAEPLVEIIKTHKHYFSSLTPDERGTTLKNCLDVLITKYGEPVFYKEISGNYSKFLQAMVNSRVRIMHIKRFSKEPCFERFEIVLYSAKMYLLYRLIIFELLQIDADKYKDSLSACVTSWNHWNGVLDRFLQRIE